MTIRVYLVKEASMAFMEDLDHQVILVHLERQAKEGQLD